MNGLGFIAAIIQALAWPFELRKPFDVLVSAANNENGWANWSGLATPQPNSIMIWWRG
jgi:hypothetical protein